MLRRLSKPGRAINNIQRRILRAFVQSGGDPTSDAALDRFLRYLEVTLLSLPPKIMTALQIAWRNPRSRSYAAIADQLSASEGGVVSAVAVRQRVSRGVRLLEKAIEGRAWKRRPVGSARR